MNQIVYWILIGLLLVLGLGLLLLTNSGFISFGKPYILRKSPELQPENRLVTFVNVNVVPMDRERVLEDQTVIVRFTPR
jgi:hypothetical protein